MCTEREFKTNKYGLKVFICNSPIKAGTTIKMSYA